MFVFVLIFTTFTVFGRGSSSRSRTSYSNYGMLGTILYLSLFVLVLDDCIMVSRITEKARWSPPKHNSRIGFHLSITPPTTSAACTHSRQEALPPEETTHNSNTTRVNLCK